MKPHHIASRCRDSEATRRFYEDFLDLHLALDPARNGALAAA